MNKTTDSLYDVLAVNLATNKVRFMAEKKTLRNAEAVIHMAVARRGVDVEFYAEVPTGQYKEGETWVGRKDNDSP